MSHGMTTTAIAHARSIALGLATLLLMPCLALPGFGGTATGTSMPRPGIQWRDWDRAAFQAARDTDRMILLNVGHEGCTACQFMKQHTFSHPEVIDLVNTHFVAIQVDSEIRPDIGERYSDWAWPANIFMAPNGTQVLAFAGSRQPATYLEILRELVVRHAAGTLEPDQLAPYGTFSSPATQPFTELRDQLRALHDTVFKNRDSGVFEHAEPLLAMLLRSHVYGDGAARALAAKTLDGRLQQLDPVWGGMHYASIGDWSNTVPEKRLESQAAALQAFAAGYHYLGETRYREGIVNVDRYLRNFMQSEAGAFFANQQGRLTTLPPQLTLKEYYDLDDKTRRQYGIPTIDHAIYSDVNARVILGYVQAFEATGMNQYLTTAAQAADMLVAQRQTPDGWIIQFLPSDELAQDERVHVIAGQKPAPYLRTQAHFGLAALALHGASGNSKWQDVATQVADAMLIQLEDSTRGGFYGAPADGTPGQRKPLEDNAAAARFLYLLAVLTKDSRYQLSAERAIRATASPIAVRREGRITGNLALALETMTASYVEFSIVGQTDHANTNALLSAARRVYEPRKVVHSELPGRYPAREQPAMYICNEIRCSVPIYAPEQVATYARQFTEIGNQTN